LPGVWFFYEVSPIHAVFEETRRSALEFISSVCAILGGVFTILGVMDSVIGLMFEKMDKKGELGIGR
jgi:endoplasmic reticulum-Golgi intermediate compartment protein 3